MEKHGIVEIADALNAGIDIKDITFIVEKNNLKILLRICIINDRK